MTAGTAIIYLAIVNLLAFGAYGIDKWKARHNRWRIPEAVLLLLAAVGGALGAFVGMRAFRHKTQHWKFRILVPLLLVLWAALLSYLLYIGKL